jgi:tripartite-type tricarboxylate transporter receptor subunit TctC
MEMFKTVAGLDIVHVPYRGGGPALNDVIAGQVPMMFINYDAALPHVLGGTLRGIAMTADQRSPLTPDMPTVGETYPGFSATSWTGLFAPAKTPPEIVERLNRLSVQALKDPTIQERLVALGFSTSTFTPAEFGRFVEAEIAKWGKVVRDAKAQVD